MRQPVLAVLLVLCASAMIVGAMSDANRYAAIAYSASTGKYAYSYSYTTRKAAEGAALKKLDQPDGMIACWVNVGYCSLALGSDKAYYGAGWTYGAGANNRDAEKQAHDNCSKSTTGVYLALTVSSDGQFIWDRRDHVALVDKDGNVLDGRGNPLFASPTPTSPATGKP